MAALEATGAEQRLVALEATNAEERLVAVEVTEANGKKYSHDAIYVGSTATTLGKFEKNGLTGYLAAKALCEEAATSETAHMCTAEELLRGHQVGVFPGIQGWMAGGAADEREIGTEQRYTDNCQGWTSNTSGYGAAWSSPGRPNYHRCDQVFPIFCCD